MSSLIQSDIKMMRDRYDEALTLQGIQAKYQFPNLPDSDIRGASQIDSYSQYIDTFIFFEGSPKIKTYKRLGWVVENDKDLPFLMHCSFNLPNLQKDSLFTISGQYSGLPDRTFRVTELSYDLQCADHVICQVIPVYDSQTVGRTDSEIKQTFNTSNHFMKPNVDYRGNYISEQEGDQ